MLDRTHAILDGNEAAAFIAYRLSEVVAIYPITPSSAMGELCDAWSAKGRANLWGAVPSVVELQSEGGAAGTVHGALQAGALATTFTASQGLLLMIPNMYKIAGELTPCAMHVTARTLATHALSIFCDHGDVMAVPQTGWALLCAGSPQEAHDLALVAHAATLRAHVPVLHFFDGFRTSHELQRGELIGDEVLHALVPDAIIDAHRQWGLSPDRPVVRGTAQNPDVFMPAREGCTPYYDACPGIVQTAMDELGARTGRRYRLFDSVGHPEAERAIVLRGSGAECAHEFVERGVAQGEKIGLVKVRLYRPFDCRAFLNTLPRTVRALAVLDRCKEPGAAGEPLYLDVVAALHEARQTGTTTLDPRVVALRYGLGSKEFTPACVHAVFAELDAVRPRHHGSVGIVDDVSGTSLPLDSAHDAEPQHQVRAVFYGLGADGTVGAAKSSIKILGEQTDQHVQGFFVYDSKKSGTVTVSHLRMSPHPIRSTYLVKQAGFAGVHQWGFLDRYDVFDSAAEGATVLVNAPFPANEVWDRLPCEVQEAAIRKQVRLFVIDAARVAREAGLGRRVNTVMQACFFALAGVLDDDAAVPALRAAAEKSYAGKGPAVVAQNLAALDAAVSTLTEVRLPAQPSAHHHRPLTVASEAPPFVQHVTVALLRHEGDRLPVSALPADGTWPVGTARWEKRAIAEQVPQWQPALYIQCNKCAFVCPHAALRIKAFDGAQLDTAPGGFPALPWKDADGWTGAQYTIQVAPDDCTGCTLCVDACPAHDKQDPNRRALELVPLLGVQARERERWRFFERLPDAEPDRLSNDVKGSQLRSPRFEFSGACTGCGETPYVKLLSQLFGDRMLVANATGCSSIYGGNLPTTPWTTDQHGRGPAWANSLFEDNAEFGYGMRLALDHQQQAALGLVRQLRDDLGQELCDALAAGVELRDGCCSCATPWCTRPSGSWAATAGRTTSASAASTPCWRQGATSTCWCSTPRSTATPAASRARPRRSERWRGSRWPARRRRRRTLRGWR
jgi:pyruvate-ferredoxin/flavodoxin oxidoreductase